jgi:nucleoside-diphosphate-sugar epimerase
MGINAMGTRNLLVSAYEHGVEEFIYASSMGVYSTPPEVLPVPENYPTKPDTSYGMSKVLGEFCCKSMSKAMKVVIARYSGAFGKGMELNRVIPTFVRNALDNKPIEVLGDGTQSSDFCCVDDIVDGTILAWKRGQSGGVYNIGSGYETVLEYLALDILALTKSQSVVKMVGNKIDRPFRFYLDITKARNELDYEPTPFHDALYLYINNVKRDIVQNGLR